MCVFVPRRGSFPHTRAICHILGQHSEWGGSGGGVVWEDRSLGAAQPRRLTALPPLASPHPPLPPVLVAGQPRGRPRPCDGGRVWPRSPGDMGMVPPPCWCRVTCLGWGIQGGHCWGCGKGGGSAWLTVLGVAAVAPLFGPESPNIGALHLRPRCCGFVAFPIVMLLGGLCPGRAGSHLLLLRGKH